MGQLPSEIVKMILEFHDSEGIHEKKVRLHREFFMFFFEGFLEFLLTR